MSEGRLQSGIAVKCIHALSIKTARSPLLELFLFFQQPFTHSSKQSSTPLPRANGSLRQVPIASDIMKFSLFSTALLMGIGLSAAAPSAEPNKSKKGPPGPPDGSYGSVSQSCSASQSSIHCCQANGGQGKNHHVRHQDEEYNLVCSQLVSGK